MTPSSIPLNSPNLAPRWHGLRAQDRRPLAVLIGSLFLWMAAAQALVLMFPSGTMAHSDAIQNYVYHTVSNSILMLVLAGFASAVFMIVTNHPYIQAIKRDSVSSLLAANKASIVRTITGAVFWTLIAIATFALFIYAYSTIKTRITAIAPFRWDETFAAWDHALFFGRDPWTVFAFLYDSPRVIRVLDYIYDAWAIILVGVWILTMARPSASVRSKFQFPFALMLTWFIGGNLLALALSSAGPCYFAAVTGLADPYAAQMAQLQAISGISELSAVSYQDMLWSVHESGTYGMGGISAMPSMHCATSALLIFMAWKRPVLRVLAMAFFALIFISSFVLAWHYAVDGLFALPIAWGAWRLSGALLRRFEKFEVTLS